MDEFKIIIAGGSLVGLTLALVLEKAGINYELFEKGDLMPQLGASIGLHPHTLRILDQLGVWADIEKEVIPLQHRFHFDGSGHCFEASEVLHNIQTILGRPIIFMERRRALEILHSHIHGKSRLHANNAISSYDELEDGVVVTTQDGLSHYGSILIGADGVHSRVRTLMAEKMSKTDLSLSQEIIRGFTSEYNCIFAVSRNDPSHPFIPDGTVHNVYYDNHSAIAAAGVPGLVFWFLFVKTGLTRTPNCPRFTDDDADALIEEYATVAPGPSYTIKDLWQARVKGMLVPLEEGVLKQWSHNRVLLLGDSAHKATVNPGLGGNLAYEGIAHFANTLVELLIEHQNPSQEKVSELFAHMDQIHRSRAETVTKLSGQITRYETQDNWFLKFASRCLVPWVSDNAKAKAYAAFSDGAPWLRFLPLPEQDADLAERKVTRGKASALQYPCVSLFAMGTLGVGVIAMWYMRAKSR
ncbi:hypothetical protein BDV25DRAFT_152791 [Aspergillus avenaceus]|uniref:FAD-binding domain-containing protein n=1 Tax=Aspergillus avenaceus TaxID=36643 RepID=A0A5N6TY79_ASPAV|nr:hypothetical protein BDV25DRAFT_152791 [Aspergillus avenaceus]